MKFELPAGKYVVAVSGGVDSVVLLHLLTNRPELKLMVAHFDHGMRIDSAEDRQLVEELANRYGLPFVYEEGKLGSEASEAVARKARYKFLHSIRTANGAVAVVTAHHQDDVLETIILNLLRGTGHRGLHSLKSTAIVKRPILGTSKADIMKYALDHHLQWHEDGTNSDTKYLRNYIRNILLLRFDEQSRADLLDIAGRAQKTTTEIDAEITNYLSHQSADDVLDRYEFVMLPHIVAREVMAVWLRKNSGTELSRQLLERLVVAAKTGRIGSKVNVDAGHWLCIFDRNLALKQPER